MSTVALYPTCSPSLRAALKNYPKNPNGICFGLETQLAAEFKALLQGWPDYSGDPEYPIPHPTLPARAAYITVEDLWSGEYGRKRLQAIEWVLGLRGVPIF